MLEVLNRADSGGYHSLRIAGMSHLGKRRSEAAVDNPLAKRVHITSHPCQLSGVPGVSSVHPSATFSRADDSSRNIQQGEQQMMSANNSQAHEMQTARNEQCRELVLYRPHSVLPGLVNPASMQATVDPQPVQSAAADTAVLKSVWRSLTPAQRKSLAGMWEALRDQQHALLKLPSHPHQYVLAASDRQQQQQQQSPAAAAACIVEELDDVRHDQHTGANAAIQPIAVASNSISAAAPVIIPHGHAGNGGWWQQAVAGSLANAAAADDDNDVGADAMQLDDLGATPMEL